MGRACISWKKVMNAAVFAACLVLAAGSGMAGSCPEFTAGERDFIKAHPVVTFSDVSWAPLAVIRDGTYSGAFHDFYDRLAELTGLTFRFAPVGGGQDFKQVLDALKDRRIDMIDGTGKTAERAGYALFAGPYMRFPLAIAARKGVTAKSAKDLYGLRVVAAKGSTAEEFLRENYPDLAVTPVDDPRAALFLVSDDQADAMLDNQAVVASAIREAGLSNVKITGRTEYVFDIYALVRSDWPLLASILEKALACVTPEEREAILARWLPDKDAPGN